MPFGLFKSWFQRIEPRVIQDEVLGEVKSTHSGHWVTKIRVPNFDDPIPVELFVVSEFPDQQQLKIAKEIQVQLPRIWKDLRNTLFEDVDAFGEGMSMEEFFDSLTIGTISIINSDSPVQWEIAASSPYEDHLFTIHMCDFVDQGFSMDG